MPANDLETRIGQRWTQIEKDYKPIWSAGFEVLLEHEGRLREAMQAPDHEMVCSDERVRGKNKVAGSLILMEDQSAAINTLHTLGVHSLTTHEGCGAALLAAIAAGVDIHDPQAVYAFMRERTASLAQAAGVEMGRHITSAEMMGDPDYHDAIALYYLAHNFDLTNFRDVLPSGFGTSRGAVSAQYAMTEAEILTGIAFGNHGFGPTRFGENPFRLVPLASPSVDLSLEQMREELVAVAVKFPPGLVKVENGLVLPV